MTLHPAELLQQALQLPESARAALAGALLNSLDEETEEGVEEAWRMEIKRRIAELDEGSVTPIPWPEARRRIAGG